MHSRRFYQCASALILAVVALLTARTAISHSGGKPAKTASPATALSATSDSADLAPTATALSAAVATAPSPSDAIAMPTMGHLTLFAQSNTVQISETDPIPTLVSAPVHSRLTTPDTNPDLTPTVNLTPQLAQMYSEHPTSAAVYEYLHDLGWSDPVIAGVLGNMMTECGGQTLDLDITANTGIYYGICQWAICYHPEVVGLDLTGQLDYLLATIESNMAYFGGNLEKFLAHTDAAKAARYFCNHYEVAEGADRRAANAKTAYSWIKSAVG